MEKRREKSQKLISVLLALTFLSAVFTIHSAEVFAQTLERKTIKIGVAAALKMTYGIGSFRGATMAVKEINDKGGVLGAKIQLFSADTEGTASKATEAIEKLYYGDKVDTIVGAFSSEEATAFQEESAKLKLNIIFHGTTHILDKQYNSDPVKYKYYWNYHPTDFHLAESVTDGQLPFLIDGLRIGLGLAKINVAVFTDAALWTEKIHGIWIDGVNKNPYCNLVYTGKISRDAVDFTPELTEFRKKDVQLVLLACGYGSSISLQKQTYDVQLPALLGGMSSKAWSISNFIKAVGVDAAAYSINSGISTMPTTPNTIRLLKEYDRIYSGDPDYDVGLTYNGVKSYAKAVEMAKSLNQDKVAEALKNVRMAENEVWGAKAFRYEDNHRVRVSQTDGLLFYTFQYTPDGRTIMLYPKEYKTGDLLIPSWMVKAWKKK
ncbi:MAG: ABC transporter substrate-binding protein [Thermodesulfobacteriota bacterium]